MKRVALAFSTKDRCDLTRRSIEPLLHPDIDLWWMDGSKTEEGQALLLEEGRPVSHIRTNVTGGADNAIVYALTTLLNETDAEFIGLAENDVLVRPDWLGPTLALFERGRSEGLEVGAVSPRCYEDRILCTRDGYSLVHNLGAGFVVYTRAAARIVLQHYRTHWSTNNVKIFHQLSGIDIRRFWAFRGSQQVMTVDWGSDAILAAHGLASLALTPSDVEMIGQDPPLHQQGLAIVREPVELLRDDEAFDLFRLRTQQIRERFLRLPDQTFLRMDDGSTIIFPHQVGALPDSNEHGDWRLKWSQGFGPFAYVADPQSEQPLPTFEIPLAGPCALMVSGGKAGGRVRVTDTQSGYEITPELPPEGEERRTMNVAVPGNVAYRTVRLTALDPGVVFYGLQVSEPQPVDPTWTFDHSALPKP